MKKTYKLELEPEEMAAIVGALENDGDGPTTLAALDSLQRASDAAAKKWEPVDEIPESCPGCGEGSEDDPGDWYTTAEDSTLYNGCSADYFNQVAEGGDPKEQPIRVFCRDCSEALPISLALAERVQAGKHEDR